ncbi:armadillo repeat-containing protein 5 [Discoglossus pictus]
MSGDSLAACLSRLSAAAEDPAGLSRALSALRSRHVSRAGGAGLFRRSGGLALLLELLTDPPRAAVLGASRRNLELALSLLANSCTEPGSRLQVRQLGGIPALVCILKSVCVDSVWNRVSRALGNLALDPQNSIIIHQTGAVPSLVHVLQSSQDAGCMQSCLRALRILGDSPSHRLSICEQGGLSPCVSLLTSPEPSLKCAAVRTVCELSRSSSLDCAEQLSPAIPVLVGMLQGEEVKAEVRQAALSTLCNLCSQGALRPMLGNAGTIQLLISEMKAVREAPSRCIHLVRALCLCCREALNRIRIREQGGLELLLDLLRDPQYLCAHNRITAAFLYYCHDTTSLALLGTGGLATLLAHRLEELAETKGEPQESRGPPDEEERASASFDFPPSPRSKRPREGTSEDSLRSWLLSEGYICSLEELSPLWYLGKENGGQILSEESSASTSSVLTVANPEASPINPGLSSATDVPSTMTLALPASSSQPLTSPTCSSMPMATPAPSTLSSDAPTPSALPRSFNAPSAEPSNLQGKDTVTSPQGRRGRLSKLKERPLPSSSSRKQCLFPMQEILGSPWPLEPCSPPPSEFWRPEFPGLLLLSRFSQLADTSTILVCPKVLSGLLTYVTCHPHPSLRAARLLQRLTCDPSCLEAFIRTGSICILRARLLLGESPEREENCRHPESARELGHVLLRNLGIQAESPFGVGTVTHILLSGPPSDRQQCALCLPYVYRKDSPHRQQLMEGALRLVLDPLMECVDSEFVFHASECLSFLSNHSSSVTQTSLPTLPSHCCYLEDISCRAQDVEFVLDGGERVLGSRQEISSRCEVFRAMLEGGYAESQQKKVRVREVPPCAFIPLIHYLHGCAEESLCPVFMGLLLPSQDHELFQTPLGSTLSAAGRFLVPGLERLLETMVREHLLTLENLPSVYSFAEVHESPGLRKDCCQFLLKRPHPPLKRAKCLLQLCQIAQDKPRLSNLLEEAVQAKD